MIKLSVAKKLFKRTRKFIFLAIIIFYGIWLFKSDLAPEFSWGHSNKSCQYVKSNGSIEILQNSSSISARSIFFLDTSCLGNLTSRQSCAIESASKAHPEWQINVIHSGQISTNIKGFPQLKKLKNVKFWRVIMEDFSKGTLLEELVKSEVLKKCRFSVERTLDVLKYLVLHKYGGIFVDLDMIVGMPLASLARNWAARENDEAVAEGVLALSKDHVGRVISETAIRDIQSNYKTSEWCNNPGTMARVLQTLCSTSEASYMSSATCNGFEVYGQQFFYPLPRERARDYFRAKELGIYNAYTYHMWGEDTNNYKVVKGSPYSKLAKRYCPTTYQVYGHHFGLY